MLPNYINKQFKGRKTPVKFKMLEQISLKFLCILDFSPEDNVCAFFFKFS